MPYDIESQIRNADFLWTSPFGAWGFRRLRRPGSIVHVLRTGPWVRSTERAGSEGSFIYRCLGQRKPYNRPDGRGNAFPLWWLEPPLFPRKRGHYKAPLCCELLMKSVFRGVLFCPLNRGKSGEAAPLFLNLRRRRHHHPLNLLNLLNPSALWARLWPILQNLLAKAGRIWYHDKVTDAGVVHR